MKRFILFSFLLMLVANNITATTTIYLLKDPQYPGPRPRSLSLTYIPVSATINEKDLSVYFDSPVGTATITVYDVFNQIIEQEVVDTAVTHEVHIPVYLWDSGDYTVTINSENTILTGQFAIP